MHDECLREIYEYLVPEAREVLAVSSTNAEGYTVEELVQAARLSTHRVRTALSELRGATLVTRGTPVCLTVDGQRLRELLQSAAE